MIIDIMTSSSSQTSLQTRWLHDEAVEVGLDEAGRGCFWGPLTAGAVIWPDEDDWSETVRENIKWIRDSKKLTEKRRVATAKIIKEAAVDWAVGEVAAHEINSWGITAANQLAFTRALENLKYVKNPERILVDGTLRIPDRDGVEQITIIDGDALYLPIAAASILAKTARDEAVVAWCGAEENKVAAERYDLAKNKGYGTGRHRAGLGEHGAIDGHRDKFVRNWIPKAPVVCEIVADEL